MTSNCLISGNINRDLNVTINNTYYDKIAEYISKRSNRTLKSPIAPRRTNTLKDSYLIKEYSKGKATPVVINEEEGESF